jgi:hypothetical protein
MMCTFKLKMSRLCVLSTCVGLVYSVLDSGIVFELCCSSTLCVRACACVYVCVRARACVRVCSLFVLRTLC